MQFVINIYRQGVCLHEPSGLDATFARSCVLVMEIFVPGEINGNVDMAVVRCKGILATLMRGCRGGKREKGKRKKE